LEGLLINWRSALHLELCSLSAFNERLPLLFLWRGDNSSLRDGQEAKEPRSREGKPRQIIDQKVSTSKNSETDTTFNGLI
jgi:hypothetical protein